MKLPLIAAAAAVLALAGCGSSGNATTAAGDTGSSSSSSSSAAGPGAGLSTSATSLGTIVVDTAGRTVYQYDADKQGASSSVCTGACASAWPAVPAGRIATGVTGKVGSITGVDGKPQATLNGWPLYYFAGDTAAGQTHGQGVGGIWWVLTPAGAKVTHATFGTGSDSSSGGAYGGGHGY